MLRGVVSAAAACAAVLCLAPAANADSGLSAGTANFDIRPVAPLNEDIRPVAPRP